MCLLRQPACLKSTYSKESLVKKQLEKKIKFFWMYTIILFSVAFVLILFSAISAGQHQDLKKDSQNYINGTQATINTLTQENTVLKTTVDGLQKSVEALSTEVEELRVQNEGYKKNVEAILTAKDLCDEGSYYPAKDILAEVDPEQLDGTVAEIYNQLTTKIENNI